MPRQPDTYYLLTDSELLDLLSNGDEHAFRVIYQRYANQLYVTAYRRLPVTHKTEDIVQEVFLRLYRKKNDGEKIIDLKAWLFVCLRRLVLNEIRNFLTHKKHDARLGVERGIAIENHSMYDLKKLEQRFHLALTQLTERCRQVFVLSRVEHLPNKKIAEQLNISIHGVEKHMTTALRVIKHELNKHELGLLVFAIFIFGL